MDDIPANKQATKRLKVLRKDLPVYGQTGASTEKELSAFLAAGLDGMIEKPITPDKIMLPLVVFLTRSNGRRVRIAGISCLSLKS